MPMSPAPPSKPAEISTRSGQKARSDGSTRCAKARRHSTRPEPKVPARGDEAALRPDAALLGLGLGLGLGIGLGLGSRLHRKDRGARGRSRSARARRAGGAAAGRGRARGRAGAARRCTRSWCRRACYRKLVPYVSPRSPPYLPHTSPVSPLHLHCVSPTSPLYPRAARLRSLAWKTAV